MKGKKKKRKPPGKGGASVVKKIESRQRLRLDSRELEAALREYRAGNIVTAQQMLRRIVAGNPAHLEAWWHLTVMAYQAGRLDEAAANAGRCLEIRPRFLEALNIIGLIHYQRRDLVAAIDCFNQALAIDPAFADGYCNLGMAYEMQYRQERARDCYQEAIARDPEFTEAYINLARLLADEGDFAQAKQCYQKIIALQPGNAQAYLNLAKIHKFSGNEQLIIDAERLLERKDTGSGQKILLAFALGKMYEDIGEHDRSFAVLTEGNRLKRKTLRYSLQESARLFSAIRNIFSAGKSLPAIPADATGTVPVFILGMPRSGTTLVEQILASHPDVYGAGELNNLQAILLAMTRTSNLESALAAMVNKPEELNRFGEQYLQSLTFFPEKARYISNKMPNNYLLIGAIRLALPQAKVIHCRRDPRDTCYSIYKNYFAGSLGYAYDLAEIGGYYLLYADLMKHWHEMFPGFIHDICYERLLEDQEGETRKLLQFCDLPWNDSCLAFHTARRRVTTASGAQVRQPIYTDSLALWKAYEKHLQQLLEILAGSDTG